MMLHLILDHMIEELERILQPQITRNGWTLTGNTRHRRSWLGQIVLQVDERRHHGQQIMANMIIHGFKGRWRDARAYDMEGLAYLQNQMERRNARRAQNEQSGNGARALAGPDTDTGGVGPSTRTRLVE